MFASWFTLYRIKFKIVRSVLVFTLNHNMSSKLPAYHTTLPEFMEDFVVPFSVYQVEVGFETLNNLLSNGFYILSDLKHI